MYPARTCSDCGKEYTELTFICPACYKRAEATDDPRFVRNWLRVMPEPGESIEDYAIRCAEALVQTGPRLTARIPRQPRPNQVVYIGWSEPRSCPDEESATKTAERLRVQISAAICAALRNWKEGGE